MRTPWARCRERAPAVASRPGAGRAYGAGSVGSRLRPCVAGGSGGPCVAPAGAGAAYPPAPPTAGAGGPVGASPGGGGREPGGFQGRAPAGCVLDRSRPCAPLPRPAGRAVGRTAAKADSGRAVTPAPCPEPGVPIARTPGRVSGSGRSGRRVPRAGAPGPLPRSARAHRAYPRSGVGEREVRPSCVAGRGAPRPPAPDRACRSGVPPGGCRGAGGPAVVCRGPGDQRGAPRPLPRTGRAKSGIPRAGCREPAPAVGRGSAPGRAGAGRLESYGAGGSLSGRSGTGAASRTRRRRPGRPPRTGSPPPCPAGGPARRAPRRRGLPGSGAPGRPTPGSPR